MTNLIDKETLEAAEKLLSDSHLSEEDVSDEVQVETLRRLARIDPGALWKYARERSGSEEFAVLAAELRLASRPLHEIVRILIGAALVEGINIGVQAERIRAKEEA